MQHLSAPHANLVEKEPELMHVFHALMKFQKNAVAEVPTPDAFPSTDFVYQTIF